ncbi:hypothetical protein KUCAC02_030901 [Chaenocephalus aceratus]|uniref:Uncharacterized protein n=1 Tax=Chaenocephalus aceratus TaxID=36190 RepID=A0ACB9XKA7_CHAAC|nr:hypothetical protein KUCAC02_030901 [Chaenocephalus aceratus]
MAAASSGASDTPDTFSMSQLVSEVEKQRASLRKDMSELIQESVKPLQSSVDALHETVNQFNKRLVAAETLAGDNFERITSTEKTVETLLTQNKSLLDRLDDMENRSRRVNLRIIKREKVLRWTRQHELKYRDTTLRVYPDVSAITAKKRAAFNKIKQALYQKGVKFRLLFPARLQVSFEDGTFTFETPEDAHAFYNERVMGKE